LGLRHYTPDKWKTTSVWTTPGGRSEVSETIEATLRREVAEEVGISDMTVESFLGEVPGVKEGDTVYIFKCQTTQEPQLLEPEKFSEWKWFSLSEIPDDFINPEVLKVLRNKL